jgi:hypothetical protein
MELSEFLDSSRCCSNPECGGVYFTHRVRTVDFVDFCGKYRIPLMKYLCSTHSPVSDAAGTSVVKMKLVLLSNYHEEDMMDFQ